MKKKLFYILFFFINFAQIFCQYSKIIEFPFIKWWEPQGLLAFKNGYPDFEFVSSFDKDENDWLIHIFEIDEKTKKKTEKAALYWCESRFLPKEKLSQKLNYRKLLYKYNNKPQDPKKFTEEDIERIKIFTTRENRRNSAIEPPFLKNVLFDCETRNSTESNIVNIPFLTLSVNVHKKIAKKVEKISEKIMKLPRDEELNQFFKTLSRTDGYSWRQVRDTQSKSYHGMGLAVDILPRGYYQKIIYWSWQKQLYPETWFLTPLEKRWSPPKKVIEIFEEEGFIWGGNWIIWDNMHFEYHPELFY